jgi:DNA-binding NarL/FixJ family response regulator
MVNVIILVGHASPVVRDGLTRALAEAMSETHCLHASTPRECIALARTHDVDMGIIDAGIASDALTELCSTLIDLGVPIVVTSRVDRDDHITLLEAGVQGIALAEDGLSSLIEGLNQVSAGNAFVPPRLLGGLLRELVVQHRSAVGSETVTDRIARLSPREREVLGLLGAGADHQAIAKALVISPHTAKTHITRLLGKLDVHSRIEAASFAVSHGLVPMGQESSR